MEADNELEPIVREVPCSTVAEFLEAISLRSEHFSHEIQVARWAFRGHSDDDYQLLPSSLRRENDAKLSKLAQTPEHKDDMDDCACHVAAELRVAYRFYQHSDLIGLEIPGNSPAFKRRLSMMLVFLDSLATFSKTRGAKVEPPVNELRNEWPSEDVVPILALAQHSGIPTRLLDWTFTPEIAAYFAADGASRKTEKNKLLSVWSMSTYAVNFQGGALFSSRENPIMQMTPPRSTNRNLNAQNGFFTYVLERPIRARAPIDRRPLDEIVAAAPPIFLGGKQADSKRHILQAPKPWFIHFTLPQSESQELLWELHRVGIHGAKCFPGFYGVAKYMREQNYYPLSRRNGGL
jgi:hypothetical protein